jgi:hypothetical protein
MKVITEKKNNQLHVKVYVQSRKRDEKMKRYTTDVVLDWLQKNKPEYKIEKTLNCPPTVHNGMGLQHLSGTWIFELASKRPAKVVKVAKPEPTAELKPAVAIKKPKKKKTLYKKKKSN